MANFAKIDDNNVVLTVLHVDDKDCLDENGNESEAVGQAYLEKHNNWPANKWIQTSRNTIHGEHTLGGTPFRGYFAGIGWTWDPENQQFFPPKPNYPSWIKNLTISDWESPAGPKPEQTEAMDTDNTQWVWSEENQAWEVVDSSTL
tara:strand:- start:2485 stop:2922 length:438 start_codon:yes stop_codon:yes gene_type:complete